MLLVDENGYYIYKPGTKTLATSSHPAWQARNVLGLPIGSWAPRPGVGHTLNQFANVKETATSIEAYEKELKYCLNQFSPLIQQTLGNRGAVDFQGNISSNALSSVPVT